MLSFSRAFCFLLFLLFHDGSGDANLAKSAIKYECSLVLCSDNRKPPIFQIGQKLICSNLVQYLKKLRYILNLVISSFELSDNCFGNFGVSLSSLSHKIFQPRTHTFWMSAQKTTLLHDVENWEYTRRNVTKNQRIIVSYSKARRTESVHFSDVRFIQSTLKVLKVSRHALLKISLITIQYLLVTLCDVQYRSIMFKSYQYRPVLFSTIQFNSVLFSFIQNRSIQFCTV